MKSHSFRWMVPDFICAAAAAYLVLSPWMFRFADAAGATWSATLIGVLLGMVVLAKAVQVQEWQDWAGLALGIWAMMAPWLLGFGDITKAAGMHVFVGLVVAITSAIQLWMRYFDPPARTA